MAGSRSHSRNASRSSHRGHDSDNDSVLGAIIDTRQVEAFGRKVTATASHLMGDSTMTNNAMTSISRSMRRPGMQRSVLSFTQQAPTELVRSKISTSEIAHRAVAFISDDQLHNIPETEHTYSLFQGFQASLPDIEESDHRKVNRRRGQKLLSAGPDLDEDGPPNLAKLKKRRNQTNHKLEMMGIRKNLCSAEIREIDSKIANLNTMRKIVLDRLANLEGEEVEVEQELQQLDNQVEDMTEEEQERALADSTTTIEPRQMTPPPGDDTEDASFMSESIYEKLPAAKSPKSPKTKRRPTYNRRKSMPVLHEHLEPGSHIRTLPAHNDTVTAIDFDAPFGTLVTSSLDDTVRVWDLNLGRCMGFLEGHTASVRCLQVEDNIVATGSLDATIRLWDISRAKYEPFEHNAHTEDDDGLGFGNEHEDEAPPPPPDAMSDCHLLTLEAHVDEVTALNLRGDTLVSGSADKTLRQWDLVKGRCVQTLDVLWAAAQASATLSTGESEAWKPTGRNTDINYDFVGALQVFETALACGTADGMVRLWDLRSGQVHRSLVGHTGAVTCLQFDDVHLVTGSADRSIRVSLLSFAIFPVTNVFTDLGSPHRQHSRCIRLRQPYH